MKLVELNFNCASRSDEFTFYVLGDVHVGAANCAEDKLQRIVTRIKNEPNSYWFGGGDMCDAVILGDAKRFDPSTLPDWLLKGRDPQAVRHNLMDILDAQKRRLFRFLAPIKDKCLGLIEGNHEYTIMKHHNRDFMQELCKHFNVINLTDCAFVRFKFKRTTGGNATTVVRAFISHGHGGGRTSGAEPNNLYRLSADKECEIILKGHSHSFCIHPPIPMLSIPARGELPDNPIVYDKHAANWGSYVYTYQTGPSTYASRANYPVRPMYTCQVKVKPHHITSNRVLQPHIEMNAVRL
jgi:hypothetical protein